MGIPLLLASISFGQEAASTSGEADRRVATVVEVIVTGSNIPTAEETGPNPVDTYRPADLEKLGIRNTTDLVVKLPQEAGATVNQNIANGGDGSVAPNLRGLQAKETLVLIDGKRVAAHALAITPIEGDAVAGADISLIPFPMIDHIDILKDGASAVYGSDAIAGVVNFFLIHKFRGLEIGGSYGNTNLGASNDMGEWEAWLKAGTGDDKTDIVIIADFWQRTGGLFSRDRDLSSNAFQIPWGGFETRSENSPGHIGDLIGFRLIPKLFFSANSPPPHSAPNVQTSPFYKNPFVIAPNAYPGPPGINFVTGVPETGPIQYKGGGDYFFYNFAAITPALPPADRQSFYGSFTRDLCDKYLVLFADFKYVRSFFDSSLAAVPFVPDPFHNALGGNFSLSAMSVPLRNPFNPFTVADATLPPGTPFAGIPVTTGVRFRAIGDTGNRTSDFITHDYLFDAGLRGQMGEFGDYFKTWNWEAGFRYSLDGEENVLQNVVSQPGLREALLDTNPATAFNPFLGIFGRNTQAARQRVYVTLHVSSQFELPLGYFSLNGDLFNLPSGPVSFALGLEYHGERWRTDPDSLNTTSNTIGSFDLQTQKLNRDVWATYQEVRIPVTSPSWNFPGFLEFDLAVREEWYSQNSAQVPAGITVIPAGHTQFNMQRPKFSVRLQPLDPKWLGALTLRGSYTEAFHAPTLGELSPAGSQGIGQVHDPKGLTPNGEVVVITTGNFHLTNETAYEWSYGAVYSPKWIKGLTLSADWWHIDLRQIPTIPGPQFILEHENIFPQDVVRDPTTGAILLVINPSFNLSGAVFEGLDYEAIYILDSGIFGHGDFGRLTWTVNGTHLARARLQISPNSKPFSIAGRFSFIGVLTGSLPRDRFFVSAFYDGPANTWMQGLDIGAVVLWIGQYEDDNVTLTGSPKLNMPRTGGPEDKAAPFPQSARKVADWTTLDLIASYTFNLPPPAPAEVPGFAKDGGKNVKAKDDKEKNVMPVSTAEYNPCGWRTWLNNTTLMLGMQNVLDADPPFVAGSVENGYDESLATIKGRFWYVQLKKRF